jgi:hypothetical protein
MSFIDKHGRTWYGTSHVRASWKFSEGSSDGTSAADECGPAPVRGRAVDRADSEQAGSAVRSLTGRVERGHLRDSEEHRCEKPGVGGSNPPPLTTLHWPTLRRRVPGGLKECPYYYKWVLDFGPFAIRLHKWMANDDLRAFHDHPYWFWTWVLWGSYMDLSVHPVTGHLVGDRLGWLSLRFRPAHHRHMVRLNHRPTWTLLLTGQPGRRWSFYDRNTGKAVKRDKYFAEYGHHPCDEFEGVPVRMKPDGSRI